MKHLACFFLSLILCHTAWSAPEHRLPDAFTFKTGDWINPATASDAFRARVNVRKIAPGIYWARYVPAGALGNRAQAYESTEFALFNVCLGRYLAEANGKPLWQMGFDSRQLRQTKTSQPPNLYFALLDTRQTRLRELKEHPISWQDEPPVLTNDFKPLCGDYLSKNPTVSATP